MEDEDIKTIGKYIILFLEFFCIYISIEVLFRGYSYPLMGCVAGMSAIIVDEIKEHISWNTPLPIQMLVATVIILLLELLSGKFSLHVLGIRMWDYRNLSGNCFEGLLCPQFALVWYILSGAMIILADAIGYYVVHDGNRPYYRIYKRVYYLPERMCK